MTWGEVYRPMRTGCLRREKCWWRMDAVKAAVLPLPLVPVMWMTLRALRFCSVLERWYVDKLWAHEGWLTVCPSWESHSTML